ncbi:kinase suppressor of Ras 2 isoform X2 [Copidosoma floridanum]|uniref:kinase suppressor of Ras 2 isoform X2 n=1 Tax=Copidosoma floridanum TaxID=29053 RepID=UPI0006C974D9|nr:kinase suppressor of Ras 2 isoform X2 [Copidosoma floridanum]
MRKALEDVQKVIDISADRLEGLRTRCFTSTELTQQEIRSLEGKLIKLYSKQLVTKEKLVNESLSTEMEQFPSLKQWLQVVGLTPESIQLVCSKTSTLEALKEKSEHELGSLLGKNSTQHKEELRRLCRALCNLRCYMDALVRGDIDSDMNLYWDSWNIPNVKSGPSPRPIRTRVPRSSVPSEDSIPYSNNKNNNFYTHALGQSSSVVSLSSTSPPVTPLSYKDQAINTFKFSTTPPISKRNQNGPDNLSQSDVFSLTKSKSHESQLANRLENGEIASSFVSDQQSATTGRRTRLPTAPGSYGIGSDIDGSLLNSSSPIKSPPYSNVEGDDNAFRPIGTSLQVPKSPRTPTMGQMTHTIKHRFTKNYTVLSTTCDFCNKPMYWGRSLKCKECKFKCHKECESHVPASCCLPAELVEAFKIRYLSDNASSVSPVMSKTETMSPNHHSLNYHPTHRKDRKSSHPFPLVPLFQGADSSSNTSSCNSSTPSSPALLLPTNPSQTPQASIKAQFHFPEVAPNGKGVTLETHRLENTMSSDSDRTVSNSGSGSVSADSERTPVRVDSQDSQVSDGESGDSRWPRQNSLSIREWDIPYDELKIGEPIGKGRFGTVYRGNWHGDVAIKVLNMDYYLDDDKTLEAFKLEVATFRKTRHDNLVLFMGACMKPPRLAIVTSMSKGMTLYTHIHLRKDKFSMNKTANIAQQICQGMGYLHRRGIVHKDLKSKNLFLENGKIVITDFGLFSVTKLCYGNRMGDGLSIPPGWLCYLAPEIVRRLRPQQNRDQEELPFTTMSDVYSFGTVWYELLCGEWPLKGQPPEAIIWQVGKGMKQSLANLQASRDVKDILMHCWSYRADNRPEFISLQASLEKLPRKRLARSPSHPIHISRSAESMF